MKIAVFDIHDYERAFLTREAEKQKLSVEFFATRLNQLTAELASGFEVVCVFVNDVVDRPTLSILKMKGVHLIALRCAGFNNVDLNAASQFGISVVRVPEYSPHAVAEHAVAMLLALNRKIHRAYMRVREMNFTLDGLTGFDLYKKTIGVIGTGRIGSVFAQIMCGFGCHVKAYDHHKNEELVRGFNVSYVSLEEIFRTCDVISLHLPLNKDTWHIVNQAAVDSMKPGVYLINTGRGGLIESKALISGLKRAIVGAAGLDVYEEEEQYFFQNLSEQLIQDDLFARLFTFPNVLMTSHQAFLTVEALAQIAAVTFSNIAAFSKGEELVHKV